jgi:hypothetical protein
MNRRVGELAYRCCGQFIMDKFDHINVPMRVPGNNLLVDLKINGAPMALSPMVVSAKITNQFGRIAASRMREG